MMTPLTEMTLAHLSTLSNMISDEDDRAPKQVVQTFIYLYAYLQQEGWTNEQISKAIESSAPRSKARKKFLPFRRRQK